MADVFIIVRIRNLGRISSKSCDRIGTVWGRRLLLLRLQGINCFAQQGRASV